RDGRRRRNRRLFELRRRTVTPGVLVDGRRPGPSVRANRPSVHRGAYTVGHHCCSKEQDMVDRVYDYIILGAGPAGLQLGYHMRSAGWDYLILEAGDGPGHFFRTFPRPRKLTAIQ